MAGEQINYIPDYQWDEFNFFFFLLRITEYQEKWAMIFFSFTRHFFLKRLFYMIHTLKPGLCWVEYILSIRGLFLPTVSWNLADGKYIIVDDYHVGRGMWYLFRLCFLFEHVPFLNYASTGKTQ